MRGRILRLVCLPFFFIITLTGCWDADAVELLDYVKTFGVDYVDEQYVVYVQLPNMSTVAKKESPGPETPAKSWIASGKGRSVNEAIGHIYRTAPKKIVWGHSTVMILSERLMQRPELPSIIEDLNRFRELRYTMWIYGTKAPIPEILSVSPTFEASRLYTILQSPMNNYKMNSIVLPLKLHDFMNDYQDKARWAIIPALTVEKEIWEAGGKPHEMHAIVGVYAFHQEQYAGFFPDTQIKGMRWIERHTVSSTLKLMEDGKTTAVLRLENPSYTIVPRRLGEQVKFDVVVKMAATLIELHVPATSQQIIERAQKLVAEEIRSTYLAGLKSNTDLLLLSQHLYRKDPKLYNKLTNEGKKLLLSPDSLGQVNVDLNLEYLGKYKFVE